MLDVWFLQEIIHETHTHTHKSISRKVIQYMRETEREITLGLGSFPDKDLAPGAVHVYIYVCVWQYVVCT